LTPSAGAKQQLRDVRQAAQAAKKAAGAGASAPAPAPAMSVQTIGSYTAAYTMSDSLRDLLGRLSSFFSHLFAAPAPTTPAQPPKNPGAKGDTNFVISSFNVLSSTAGIPKGFASGTQRIQWAAQILDQHNVSVAGLQEMKADQLATFKRVAGDKYGTFAGASGKKGYYDTTIVWRKDTWDLQQKGTLTVPSYDGIASKVPYVRLKNKQTGQEAYFIDVHNPANTKHYHHQEGYRNAAAKKEAALVKQLQQQTGLPVFVTGDFNDVGTAHDIMTKDAGLVAASDQTHQRDGIDWVFGSKGVQFSHFTRTRDGMISKTTDHPVVFTQAQIKG
jgi:exonuclease III